MHDCLQFAHLKLVNGSSLWTSSQMFTYCCTVSEVWFTVIIQATLWLRRTQDYYFFSPKVGMHKSKRQNSWQLVKHSKLYSDRHQSLEISLFGFAISHFRGRGEGGESIINIQEYTDTSMSLVLYIHTSTTVKTGWHRRIWSTYVLFIHTSYCQNAHRYHM